MVGGIRPVTLALLVLALLPASATASATTQIIVKRDAGLSASERRDIRADAGVKYVESLPLPRTEVVAAEPGEVRDALRDLNADPDVVYAEPDRPVHSFAATGLWNLDKISVADAWPRSTGAGRTVAVVDSGIDASHPALKGRVAAGFDFVEDDADAQDEQGHGTHVAGIVAAPQSGFPVAGVAPGARVVPLRVLDGTGSGSTSDVVAAFDWAGKKQMRVVNASLGGSTFSQAEHDVIAQHPDTLFVVAAGNDGKNVDTPGNAEYPCAYTLDNVLCVGATDRNDARASFSNFGATSVDVFAPGVDIASTRLGAYYLSDGTSMATPHVAGVAAQLAARAPWLGLDEFKQTIIDESTTVAAGRLVNAATVAGKYSADPDGDGWILDENGDTCAFVYNPDQALDPEGNPICPAESDRDDDGVLDDDDLCPDEEWSGPNGCPVAAPTPPDADHDGVRDARDLCPKTMTPGGFGCPDPDRDRIPNDGRDNCPNTYNPTQADADRDGIGDACDSTPRGPDVDRDGKPALDDRCPTVYGTLANGCPPPKDTDSDGLPDTTDACDTVFARTANGCPPPAAQVASLTATPKRRGTKRSARIVVKTTDVAVVQVTVQRKKGAKWVRVTRKARWTVSNRVALTVKGLKRGRHRVKVSINSANGRGTPAVKGFRVR